MVPYIIAGLLIFLICYAVIHQYGFKGTMDGVVELLTPIYKWLQEQLKTRLSPLQQAEFDYRSSLQELKNYPTNADLRMKTLELGRKYSGLTRKDKRVTIFDEMALSNDISAACAGASIALQVANKQVNTSMEERLFKLKTLHDKGLINNDEYAEQRKKILSEI